MRGVFDTNEETQRLLSPAALSMIARSAGSLWMNSNCSPRSNRLAGPPRYDGQRIRRRAIEDGAMEFISKPIDFDQLKAQLKALSGSSS
jgi:hypothetical protein